MDHERWATLSFFVALALVTACSDSRQELPFSPQGSSEAREVLVDDVPGRELNKWARASDTKLRDAVEKAGGRVIVGVKEPGATRGIYRGRVLTSSARYESAKAEISARGARIAHEYSLSPSFLAEIEPSSVGAIRRLDWMDYFEPDLPGKWLSQDTTWNVQKVGAPYAWALANGNGVDLLIIDSGIDDGNWDLDPESVQACDKSDGSDAVGHGSFVSGIAAAVDNYNGVIGVASGVDLRSSRVGGDGGPTPSAVKCAIEYGRTNDFFVMSMSLQVDTLESLIDEIESAWNDGHLLVAAAGDSAGSVIFPAYHTDVIAVTATNESNGFWGPEDTEVELAAPGGLIITSTGSDDGDYPFDCTICTDTVMATSYATPHVAAAAAIVKSYYTGWTNEDIRDQLQETAVDLGTTGWDNQYGYGLLDITAAMGITPLSSVSISGPDEIQPEDENCTWTAVVSGGVAPYGYTWRYDGYWVSSGSSWTGGLNPLDEDEEFTLTLWVTDQGNQSVSDTLQVTTSENAWWCTYKEP